MSTEQTVVAVEVYGPFVRLSKNVWVRGDAIVIVRSRTTSGGEGSEVVLRATSTGSGGSSGYTVWTDIPAQDIMDAVLRSAELSA
jgi:hypothetical protein